jgi:hypothetical protein
MPRLQRFTASVRPLHRGKRNRTGLPGRGLWPMRPYPNRSNMSAGRHAGAMPLPFLIRADPAPAVRPFVPIRSPLALSR